MQLSKRQKTIAKIHKENCIKNGIVAMKRYNLNQAWSDYVFCGGFY